MRLPEKKCEFFTHIRLIFRLFCPKCLKFRGSLSNKIAEILAIFDENSTFVEKVFKIFFSSRKCPESLSFVTPKPAELSQFAVFSIENVAKIIGPYKNSGPVLVI